MKPMKSIEEVVGENVRRWRKAAGWSQVKLAEKADVSQRVVSNIEHGGQYGSSSIGILNALSVALGAPTFLMMTDRLPTDKTKVERMAEVMQSYGDLSDHAQQRILEIVEDYKQIGGGE